MSSTTSVDASLSEHELTSHEIGTVQAQPDARAPVPATVPQQQPGPPLQAQQVQEAAQESQDSPESRHWQRQWPAYVALVALLPALEIAVLVGHDAFAFTCLAAWALVAVGQSVGRAARATVRDLLKVDARTALAFSFVLGVGALTGLLPLAAARACMLVVLGAGLSTMALRWFQPRKSASRRVVLVGSHQAVESYAASGTGEELVAGCHVVDAGAALAGEPTLLVPTTTSLDTLSELASTVEADSVLVLPGQGVTAELVRDLSWTFEDTDVTVGIVTPVSAVSPHRLRTTVSGMGTVLEVGAPRASVLTRIGKALVDRVGGVVLLAFAAPVLALMWVAVRVDTAGPGLFVQTRVGRDGKPFRMYKMRTMHRDAEAILAGLAAENESDGVLFKIRRDPRVTRVGSWLRRSSLDELPQLLNVVRGEMSLVGPRPALPSEVASYDHVTRRRLVVKPGITGLWQVSGRSDLQWEESLRLDLYYADNWRLVDDFTIAARTVSAVTMARGAY